MAKELNVVVKEVIVHNTAKQIYVANDMIYNIVGEGPSAGAMITPIDEATDVELFNALGPSDINRWPLAASLAEMADFTMVGEDENHLLIAPANYYGAVTTAETENNTANEIAEADDKYTVDNSSFDKAVNFLANCSAEDFIELVKYAQKHGNTFCHCVSEVRDCVNADDAYCAALVQLTRPFGEKLENKAFKLFDNIDTLEGEEAFAEFWDALKVINS